MTRVKRLYKHFLVSTLIKVCVFTSINGAGVYAAPSVPVGRYEITVSKEGFQSQVKTGIDIVVGQSVEENFDLSVR